MIHARIAGIGAEIPPRRLSNEEWERMTDTSAEWLEKNVGIRTRSRIGEDQSLADLGSAAARRALDMAGLDAADLDYILCATNSQDDIFPSTASKIQQALGAESATSSDLQAGCTGWLYAMQLGCALVRGGEARRVLVIGVESLIRSLYLYDRDSALFGDGAGAAVITAEDADAFSARANGHAQEVSMPIFATNTVPSFALHHPTYHHEEHNAVELYLEGRDMAQAPRARPKMDGKASMKLAINGTLDVVTRLFQTAQERYGLSREDVDVFMPHQTNVHLVKKMCETLGYNFEDIPFILDKYGCISTAAMPTGLWEHMQAGKLKRGDLVLCAGYGAGWTCGAMLFRWDPAQN